MQVTMFSFLLLVNSLFSTGFILRDHFLCMEEAFLVFSDWDSLHLRLNIHCRGMELQEKEAQKD